MNNINIRIATISDLPVLLAFEQGIITFERPYDETLKPDPISYYDIKALIESTVAEVIVAVCGEEVVGSAYIQIRKAEPYLKHDDYGYLGFMFVKPAYRGQGINKQIIAELIVWAKTKNLTELRLDVYDENHSAVSAYKKAGFEKQLVNMRMAIE